MLLRSRSLRSSVWLGLVSIALISSSKLFADIIVSPNAAVSGEGNLDSNLPFSVAAYSFTSMRYQQVYGATEFSSITGPRLITAISFRPNATNGFAFTENLTNVEISLSTTQAQPDNMSAVFANNVGPDITLLHSGPLVLSSAFLGPISGPKDFDITINFANPFVYDPSQGRLLLDIRSFLGGSVPPMDAFFVNNDSVSRVMTFIGQNANSTSGNVVDTLGIATQFTFVPVPEPSTFLLTAVATSILANRRRRK